MNIKQDFTYILILVYVAESENEDCGVTIMMVVFAFVVRFVPLTWNIKQIKN